MRLGSVRTKLARNWPSLAVYAGILAAVGALLAYRLATLPGGYSRSELATAQAALSWRHIFEHPVNAPFLAAARALNYVVPNHLYAGRLVAAGCGLATVMIFYAVARYLYGGRTALFGTALFGSSAWFLHTARLGVPDVLLFGLLALVACYLWLLHTSSGWALLAGFILTALALYVPGMVWFIGIGVLWQWRTIDRQFKKNLWAVSAGGAVVLAALVPLGLAIYHHPSTANILAGLPAHGWPQVMASLQRLADVPLHVFIQGQLQPEHWVGRLPVLDYCSAAMFFLGGYVYLRHRRLKRSWLIAVVLLAGAALIGVGGATLTIIVPFLYLVAAAGTGLLLDRWLTVFPRNVIAQSVGGGLLVVAVLAAGVYSAQQYFIAWPHVPETRQVFTIPASVTIGKN